MKIKIISDIKIICSNEHGIHNYFAWPSVAKLQDGSLLGVASGFRVAHVCPFGKVVAFRSYDEGVSWTAPEVIIDTPLDDRDGGICTFGEQGVMVTSFNNTPTFQRNRIHARATYVNAYLDEMEKCDWQKYYGSTLAVSHDGGKTYDNPIVVPITSPHGPLELSDGRILYVGSVFEYKNEISHIECHILDESGKTSLLSRIEDIDENILFCEPHAIQLKSGRIVVHIRAQQKGRYFTIYQSISDDHGKTFSRPVQLLADKGGAPAHLLELSSGVLISVYSYREEPYGIRAMFSKDGGETWDTDNILIDSEPASDLGYPCSVELFDGSILTIFYSRACTGGASVIKQVIWRLEE